MENDISQSLGLDLDNVNLELGKASTNKNVISQSLGLDLVNINVYAEVYQYIPLSSRDKAIFTFSEFGARQSLDR